MYTPVKLDKMRNILLGFKGMQLFKKITGKSLTKLDYENEDMEDYMPVIIYCGLIHEDKDLTLDETTELIDKHLGIKGALALLPKILEDTFGKEEDIKNLAGAAKSKKGQK